MDFWEHWYWVMFLLFTFYFVWIYEQSIGVKGLFATPVRYEAPEGMSVMTAGLLYDNFTDYKDLLAGVLELSHKGYVRLIHQPNGDLYVEKINKPYGKLRDIECFLLNDILFSNAKKRYVIPKERYIYVRGNDAKKRREPTARQKVMMQDFVRLRVANSKFAMGEGYIKKSPIEARWSFILQSTSLFVLMIVLGYFSGHFSMVGVSIFVFCFFIPQILFLYLGMHVVSVVFAFVPISLLIVLLVNEKLRELLPSLVGDAAPYLIFMSAFTIVWKFYGKVSVLTPKGREIRRHLMGLKLFLSRVKEDEIERLHQERRAYMDALIPYMKMFGLASYDIHYTKDE